MVFLAVGATITITKSESNGFFIYTTISETCEHPRDYIYMPWGYSPWINASSRLQSSSQAVVALVISSLSLLLTSLLGHVVR